VAVCGGPEHLRGRACPLVATGECALVDQADVVVNGLGLERRDDRAVLEAIRRTRPERRVVVEATDRVADRHRELLEGCDVVAFPMRTDALVRAVEHALDAY
jgi:DNA-binding NarL/FixJ family response regulator